VDVREQFILRAKSPNASISGLCREFKISRKTGYKWLQRFEERGVEGLRDQSRRPLVSLRVTGETVLRVLELHGKYRWGPKKLHALLRREKIEHVPSARTIARILRRAGFGPKRRRLERIPSAVSTKAPSVVAEAPNDVWTVDFKGYWRAGNGERCEPLTVRDAFSRCVLCARILKSHATELVRLEFERIFREFGVPKVLQFDNGEPFAAVQGRGAITRLSAWWVSLGIRLVRSRPAKPQDNGAHERMHGDIMREVESKPAQSRLAQQRALTMWRKRFNDVRPHEALGMRTPSELYRRSERIYVGPSAPTYAEGWLVRRVSAKGLVKIEGAQIFIGEGLGGQEIGLEPVDNGHRVWFYEIDLGVLHVAA